MNQNKQDNKPERTAMDELINYVETQQEKHTGHGANDIWRQCQRIIDKAVELRDTAEKQKIIQSHVAGQAFASKHDKGYEDFAGDYYYQKYGTHGK